MAISTVQIYIGGSWHTLTYNTSTGNYEATVSAPGTTSYNQPEHYYAMQIKARNTAGTETTATVSDPTVGDALKLYVRETVKPTINITSPGAGAYIANDRQPIVFQLRDEGGGSGVNLGTLALSIDGGAAQGSTASGMVCTAVSGGYDCVYTPPAALGDGQHTITIDVSDNDGNAAVQAARTYTVDTVPPALNVTNPADGFIVNTAAMIVQGITNGPQASPVTVTITLNGTDQGAVTLTSGNFTKSVTLTEGDNTIVVRATDAAGQYSEVTINGTLDTSAPVIQSVTVTPNPADTDATMTISVVVSG